jgi:predicted ATPase
MAWISDSDGGVIRWKDIKAFEALVRADEREQALAAPVQEPVFTYDQVKAHI